MTHRNLTQYVAAVDSWSRIKSGIPPLHPALHSTSSFASRPAYEKVKMEDIVTITDSLKLIASLSKKYRSCQVEMRRPRAFRLSLNEWTELMKKREKVERAIREVRTKSQIERTKMVKQYRWLCVKRDGSGVDNMATEWNYLEKETHRAGERACEDDCRMYVESRPTPLPSAGTVHNATYAYLLRKAMQAHQVSLCPGCCDDPARFQPNQEAHDCLKSWEEVAPMLYDAVKDKVSPFDVGTLHHSVTSALKMPHGLNTLSSYGDVGVIRDMVLDEIVSQPELYDLCSSIHKQEIRELSPVEHDKSDE